MLFTAIEHLRSPLHLCLLGFTDWGQIPAPRKPWKHFGPLKAFLVICIKKRRRWIRLKLLIWREHLFILRTKIKHLCYHTVWNFPGDGENVSGPSRNGPCRYYLSLAVALHCKLYNGLKHWLQTSETHRPSLLLQHEEVSICTKHCKLSK